MSRILQNLVNGKWCKTKNYHKVLNILTVAIIQTWSSHREIIRDE